jgi:hypothetical protein
LIFDLVEDCASKSGGHAEVGCSEFGKGSGEIEKAAIRSALQDSDCTNDREMSARGRETSFLIVHKDVLRCYLQRKRDCLLLADIQDIDRRIGRFNWGMDFEPGWGIFHPVPYKCRSAGVSKFLPNCGWDQNAVEQGRKYVDVADHQKVP